MKKNLQKLQVNKRTIANLKGGLTAVQVSVVNYPSRKETCLCMTVTSPCETEIAN